MRTISRRLAALAGVAVLCGVSSVSAGQAAKADVTGKWVFTVETSAGSGTPTLTLKQDGEKLTGHYSGQLGEADLTGTLKGSDIKINFTGDVQGNSIACVYTGTVDSKDAMKGNVDLVGVGTGTFTAKRQ
jgi:hypothetical protein